MVKRKFEFGLSNGFCTTGGAISGEKKELLCQVARNMGKLPHYRDKCHILQQCHKIIVTHNNNMGNNKIVCPYCGKNNFKCSRGLTQHLRNAAYCSQAEKEKKTRKMGTLPHLRRLHLETIIGKCIITSLLKEPSKWMIEDWQGANNLRNWPNTLANKNFLHHFSD
jgi:hypothetical protein